MSLIKIPDGDNQAIYFESFEIVAVREHTNPDKTYIFLRNEVDPWVVDCPIDTVLSIIPIRDK